MNSNTRYGPAEMGLLVKIVKPLSALNSIFRNLRINELGLLKVNAYQAPMRPFSSLLVSGVFLMECNAPSEQESN